MQFKKEHIFSLSATAYLFTYFAYLIQKYQKSPTKHLKSCIKVSILYRDYSLFFIHFTVKSRNLNKTLIFQHFSMKQSATKYTFSDIFVEISAFYLIFAAYSMQNQKSLFDISSSSPPSIMQGVGGAI